MYTSLPDKIEISGATIHKMSYSDYLPNNLSVFNRVKYGWNRASTMAKLRDPGYLHRLYLEGDKGYLKYLHDFKDKYSSFDVIVMNPGVDLVHPEFLFENFKSSMKILHFIDDPHMTYSYGLPFSWAFDGATYISPSYSPTIDMKRLLNLAGFRWTKWLPHCVTNINSPYWTQDELSEQLKKRTDSAIYVGGFYRGKEQRLLNIKQGMRSDFDVFGNFPFKGISHGIKLLMQSGQFSLVRPINNKQRTTKYMSYKIGINMHLSSPAMETGNARLYEIPFHGMAQVADVSEHSLVEDIFENEKDILLYRNTKECVELTRMLLNDDCLRRSIALNGYKKTINHYTVQKSFSNLIDFLKSK